MIQSEPKNLYSRFLKGHEGVLHFAAHSHHFWPDISREAQLEYWDDCALTSDSKWNKIFGEVIPQAQSHIASMLNLKHAHKIAFAPNTHELTTRILSLFLGKKDLRLLTTSSEFHSWKRQILRLQELPGFTVDLISTESLLENRRSFIEELKVGRKKRPDLFFISQVFFDSGLALTMDELIELKNSAHPETLMVIDGYHACGAIPTDLSKLEGQVFYLAGGYKYLQAGEGVAFMVIPEGNWRPAYTGWFAEYAALSRPPGSLVGYSQDYMAFMGATQDPSGLYRFNAVWKQFTALGMDIAKIHHYVQELQKLFLEKSHFPLKPLFDSNLRFQGHFLTYEAESEQLAEEVLEKLKKAGVVIDRRGRRLRFGFGPYQNKQDVISLCQCLENLAMK